MRYNLVFTEQFNQDVAALYEALAEYPSMAKRIFQEMERKLEGLKDNPFMWPTFHGSKYRRINLEGNALFYTVDEHEHEVRLYHLYYAKRDLLKLLGIE